VHESVLQQHLVRYSGIKRIIMHDHAKFSEDPSNRYLDMAILLLSR